MSQLQPTMTIKTAGDIAEQCFSTDGRDLIGIEVEWPTHREGRPDERATLPDLAEIHAGPLPHRGRVTIEPGGQLEISTQAFETPSEALTALSSDAGVLHNRLAAAGLEAVDLAVDDRRPPARILDKPRYAAMEAHFARRGRAGTWMMTNTASLQINLSYGNDRQRRWQVLNRIGPLLIAAFANSPGTGPDGVRWKSVRQAIWGEIDPSRTSPVPVSADPQRDWVDYALAAEVFYVDHPTPVAMVPAISFRQWITEGHEVGWPSEADFCYHLTTLFPPIRPRRWLELRMIDALPPGPRAAVVHIAHTATRDEVADELLHSVPDTSALWQSAARDGLSDPGLRKGVRTLMRVAMDYLEGTPGHHEALDSIGAFADRYTLRDRCPADDRIDCRTDAFVRNVARRALMC